MRYNRDRKLIYLKEDIEMDYKLEEAMKNNPAFMPFTHCNTKTNIEEVEEKKKADSAEDTK